MTGAKGVRPGVSGYLTHNWCSHCDAWRIGKPVRCPDCNRLCRYKVRFREGKNETKMQRM
jgi:hypothetical protein